jgi:MoxR-like ATPase
MATVPELDPSQVAELGARLRENIARAVKAPDQVLRDVLVALVAEGHVLIEDYPGVGKTALARALARSIEAEYARVQCTADLLPADVVGTNVYNQRENRFEFRPGPVFANVVLVDEVNRASPKTQSGLLECMQERHVTVDKHTHELARPFLVVATQNPVEYEGTYPLPEAQLDRFLLKVVLPVPPRVDEMEILRRHAHGFDPRRVADAGVRPVAGPDDLTAGQAAVRRVQVTPEVAGYIVDIARATRESPSLSLGVSPRGATALLRAARAWAWLNGRDFVTPDDVKALAHATLVHRLGLRPEAELEGVDVAQVLASALGSVPVPR